MFNKNKYRKTYFKIIFNARRERRIRLNRDNLDYIYYENHHIFPESMYPHVATDKRYMVLLTAYEHFIVHHLLTKFVIGHNKFKMLHAISRMLPTPNTQQIVDRYRPPARQYEFIRIAAARAKSEYYLTDEYKNGPGKIQRIKRKETLKSGNGPGNITWGGVIEKIKVTMATPESQARVQSGITRRLLFRQTPEGQINLKKGIEKTKKYYATTEGKKQKLQETQKIKEFYSSPEGIIKKKEETAQAMATKSSATYKTENTFQCEHCGRGVGGKHNYNMYHGNNCKDNRESPRFNNRRKTI